MVYLASNTSKNFYLKVSIVPSNFVEIRRYRNYLGDEQERAEGETMSKSRINQTFTQYLQN